MALAGSAFAQPAPAPPQEQTGSADPAADFARAAAQIAAVNAPVATLVFENRPIVEFRATVLLRTPAMRAAAAERFLRNLVNESPLERVVTRPLAGAQIVSVGALDAFGIVPADLDPLGAGTIEDAARRAAASLQLALDEAIELRTPLRIAKSLGWALLATVVFVLLCRLLMRGHRWAVTRTASAADRQLQRLPGGEVVRASRLPGLLGRLVTMVCAVAAVAGRLLVAVLRAPELPVHPPLGRSAARIPGRTAHAIRPVDGRRHPGPVYGAADCRGDAVRHEAGRAALRGGRAGARELPGVHPDTAPTTRRLTTALLWLFALALAYPHLPGSDTDAFKGVSVFVGLMISLGSSGIVNQVMSGLTMTYSRALTKGDFVRIGDVEGTVTQMGMLSTKLQTSRREELTIPNAVVISTVTTNYSRLQREEGVFVPTSITIGYDAPWRQVHALLVLAAERTSGIRRDPPPSVRQAGLRDFYVEYTLLVCLEDPASKALVLDALHANIQDAFNEYGVQIMSPNYEADPSGPKIVPPDKWFAAPAATTGPDARLTRAAPIG